jgi:5S rRNA maturation endonuclease (ribonuclease M5)
MTLEAILMRLKGARRTGNGWEALCPAHEDHSPSLSVCERDGKILLHDHGGCTTEAICEALGIEMRDLFTEAKLQAQIVATYDYTDEHGALLYQVVRFEPKGFRQRRPNGAGGWTWEVRGVRRVLYRLPEVLKAQSVIVVEGQKDVETARELGLVATTKGAASAKWLPEYSEALRGKKIVIVPDSDEPGRKDVQQQIAPALAGKAESLKLLEMPGAKDLSEWVEHDGTREALLELIRNAPAWIQASERPARTDLRSVTIEELLKMEIRPREQILSPILPTQGLGMLYAKRGVGKTHLALGIGYAVSTGGSFLHWSAPKPSGVCYVDGELPGETLKEWACGIVAGADVAKDAPAPFRIITPDLQDGPMPDLATVAGQAALEPHLEGVELLILDNLSALCRVSDENEGGDWVPVQGWLLGLRRRGITVLLLHHAGKSGAQRGTSRREDLLDVVINLRHSADYSPEEGLRCEVHYEKCRAFYGKEARPFEVRMETDASGAAVWTMRDIEDVMAVRAAELFADGMSIRDVADELGISKSTAHRLKKKANVAMSEV